MAVVLRIIILWIASHAWIPYALLAIEQMYGMLVTERAPWFDALTAAQATASELMTEKNLAAIDLALDEDFSRKRIAEAARTSRLIAKGTQAFREGYSRQLLRWQRQRRSLQWTQDAEHHCLELEEIEGKRIAAEAETRRLLRCIADGEPCSICTEQVTSPKKLTTALCRGKHVFHKDCMAQWQSGKYFRRDPRCPNCRDTLPRGQTVTGQ